MVFNSNLFNIIPIPGLVEAVKYNDIKKFAGKENSLYIVTIEKLSSLIVYFLLIILIFSFLNLQFYTFSFFSLILFLALIILYKKKYNLPYVNYPFQRLAIYYKNFNYIFFTTFFISGILQTLSVLIPLYIFYELRILQPANFATGFFIIILSNFIASLPISVLGIGIRDMSYFFLGAYFLSISPNDSLVVSSILNILAMCNQFICIIVSVCYFFWKKNYNSSSKIKKQYQLQN